jgi:hypothetical protein
VYFSTELTEYEQSVMEMGIEVERVARGLFPDGAVVTGSQTDALQETRALIASNTPTLFQPVPATNFWEPFSSSGVMVGTDCFGGALRRLQSTRPQPF